MTLKQLNVRLSDAERQALEALAAKNNTTVYALARTVLTKLAEREGAVTLRERKATRGDKTILDVRLYPREIAALRRYADRNDYANRNEAAAAAIRATLVRRGDLVLEDDTFPDHDAAAESMGPQPKPEAAASTIPAWSDM